MNAMSRNEQLKKARKSTRGLPPEVKKRGKELGAAVSLHLKGLGVDVANISDELPEVESKTTIPNHIRSGSLTILECLIIQQRFPGFNITNVLRSFLVEPKEELEEDKELVLPSETVPEEERFIPKINEQRRVINLDGPEKPDITQEHLEWLAEIN